MRMEATVAQAVELSMDCSQSFASRRHRPSHANVRSTTHRLGSTSKPCALSDRLMISRVQSPLPRKASRSLSPAFHLQPRIPASNPPWHPLPGSGKLLPFPIGVNAVEFRRYPGGYGFAYSGCSSSPGTTNPIFGFLGLPRGCSGPTIMGTRILRAIPLSDE